MIGIGGIFKAVVALVFLSVIVGGIYYISNMQASMAILEINNKQLEDGIKNQQALIEQQKADIESVRLKNKELADQNDKQKKDVENLSNKFHKKDIGQLAAEKPELMERLVNRGTTNALRCLELASGAPLNEKELSAKSPTEANRECPSLINPAYSSSN